MAIKKMKKNINRISVDYLISNDSIRELPLTFIDTQIDRLNYVDIIKLLNHFFLVEDSLKKIINRIKELDKTNDLLCKIFNHEIKYNTYDIVNLLIENNSITLSSNRINDLEIQLKKLIDNELSKQKIDNSNALYLFVKKIKNIDYIFNTIINNCSDIEDVKFYVYMIILNMNVNTINDEVATLIAPYALHKQKYKTYNCSYIALMTRVCNISVLKSYVLATKDKEIIAYYIFKAKDHKLMKDLFVDENTYLSYCKEVFGEYKNIYDDMIVFVREDCKYDFVNENIKKYIDSSNEKPNITIY